jgi:hypothetical protein
MPNIDIAVDADLSEAFQIPSCTELGLPNAGPLKIQLPTGGSIQAFADISKGIPTDCALCFSLMIQIAPFLAATECLLKVLKLLKPLIDVVGSLGPPPDPIKLPKAIQEFAKAAVDLAPCLLVPTPASILPFIKDLLCLILKVLSCFLSQLKSLLKIMGPLALQLQAAEADGNSELASTIKCAQKNAEIQGAQLMNSLGPVGVLLDLAGPLFGIAGVQPIQLPSLGSATDLNALKTVVQSVQSVKATIQIVADGLGGCGS